MSNDISDVERLQHFLALDRAEIMDIPTLEEQYSLLAVGFKKRHLLCKISIV